MNEIRFPLEKEEPKHRKKSKKKGQPRANHKHKYETVLLHISLGGLFNEKNSKYIIAPTKVCVICGRIGHLEEARYEQIFANDHNKVWRKDRIITNEPDLEKWYCDSLFDKFAKKYSP